ncbi:MAG: sodium/solute symporter [Rhodothermaceae bacterium]|nr:sodium/solute symporter [Rhodothermaceae bacterium]
MNTQLIVFGLYFLIIFLIGLYGLKRTKNEVDYWIAGGRLGWPLGGATMAATHTSAGTFIGTIGLIYTAGWSFGWLLITIPLGYWLMVAFLAPRFTKVKQLTLPAFIETRYYSKTARAIAASIILVATIVYIQAQIIAGGLVANVVFGISPFQGMLIFTAVLIFYTLFGGMLAVVYTDLLQLIIMFVGSLLAVPFALRQVGSFDQLIAYAQVLKPDTFEWSGISLTLLFTMGLALLLSLISTPDKLTRLYVMKDMRTIRRGILLTIVTVCTINLLVFVLALAGIAVFPSLPAGDLAMPLIAHALLPPVLGAILLAAVTAAMMSTVDSLLLVAGSALSEDIYNNVLYPNATKEKKLLIARFGIFIVGLTPLILILYGVGEGTLIQFIVLLFAALMASSFCIPVLGGVLWKRATKEGAIASMIGGVSVTMLWKVFGFPYIDPVVPGFISSLLLMIFVSLSTQPPPEQAIRPFFNEG